jgi:hypothetical protein
LAFTTVTGASGAPTTYTGTDGVDLITLVNPGASDLSAEANNDVINVALAGQNGATVNTASNQTLRGGQGDDSFTVTGGNLISSIISGNLGNDTFTGSLIASTVQGGQGNDTLVLSASNGGAFLNGNMGNDVLTAVAAATYSASSLLGGQGNDTITLSTGAGTIAQGVRIEGNDGADTLTVGALAAGSVGVSATGGSGNDTITAAAAAIATALFGGDGNDTVTSDATGTGSISGGEGVDTLAVSAGGGGTSIDVTETIQLRDTTTFEAAKAGVTGITVNGNSSTVANFDVVTGAYAGASATQKDQFDFGATAAAVASAAGATYTTDSTATVNGQVITSFTVGNVGATTFTLNDGSTLVIDNANKLAAAVNALSRNTLFSGGAAAAGASVVFNGVINGQANTYVYYQLSANSAATAGAGDGYNLVQFTGTYTGIETAASNTSGYLFIS